MDDFKVALVGSFERVQKGLANVDVSKSEATHKPDQDMIHAEIKRTMGFTKMNELVQTRLTSWVNSMVRSLLAQMDKMSPDRLKLHDNLARMLRESGSLDEAESCFRELYGLLKARNERDSETLSCLNQLAVTLQKRGKHEEGIQMHRECLKLRRGILGEDHDDTLQSASNLAVMLSEQEDLSEEDFAEARHLYVLAISGREKSKGVDHPATLYTVSNLAKLLSERAPERCEAIFLEAEALHERATVQLTQKLGPSHPLALTVAHNRGSHWIVWDRDSEMRTAALQLCQQVLKYRTEKLGKEHPDTQLTETLLRSVQRSERKRRTSLTSLGTEALSQCLEARTWKEFVEVDYPVVRSAVQFHEIRHHFLKTYGVSRLRKELEEGGYVEPTTQLLTKGMQPFNVFARIASGAMVQANMAAAQERLGKFRDRYVVACNRPECDDMWNNSDPTWMGKASMSRRHRMLTTKDLHWEWFNILTFGLVSGLDEAIKRLVEMREAALHWVAASRQDEGWPQADRIGLFVHVYGHASVNSFHLHIVDMDNVGPTFGKLECKNLPIDDAILALQQEGMHVKTGSLTEQSL
jgi:tetratricopeptide (TPR) repeat protein